MILKLPDVTLFAIDCFTPLKTLAMMDISMRFVDFGDAMLLTNTDHGDWVNHPAFIKEFWPDGTLKVNYWRVEQARTLSMAQLSGIKLLPHKESTEKCPRPEAPHHPPLPKDYERAVMVEPSRHASTDFILHMEWDSAVLNPLAWTDDFLKYDYIGAPWWRHTEPGWPTCDETNNVGNGGFSLKSQKYCQLIAQACEFFHDHPGIISSDMWPCRSMRPWLEHRGIKFAPAEVAYRFSCENQIYSGQFGFHGRWTAEMNGWGGVFKHIRPK